MKPPLGFLAPPLPPLGAIQGPQERGNPLPRVRSWKIRHPINLHRDRMTSILTRTVLAFDLSKPGNHLFQKASRNSILCCRPADGTGIRRPISDHSSIPKEGSLQRGQISMTKRVRYAHRSIRKALLNSHVRALLLTSHVSTTSSVRLVSGSDLKKKEKSQVIWEIHQGYAQLVIEISRLWTSNTRCNADSRETVRWFEGFTTMSAARR